MRKSGASVRTSSALPVCRTPPLYSYCWLLGQTYSTSLSPPPPLSPLPPARLVAQFATRQVSAITKCCCSLKWRWTTSQAEMQIKTTLYFWKAKSVQLEAFIVISTRFTKTRTKNLSWTPKQDWKVSKTVQMISLGSNHQVQHHGQRREIKCQVKIKVYMKHKISAKSQSRKQPNDLQSSRRAESIHPFERQTGEQ